MLFCLVSLSSEFVAQKAFQCHGVTRALVSFCLFSPFPICIDGKHSPTTVSAQHRPFAEPLRCHVILGARNEGTICQAYIPVHGQSVRGDSE